MLVYYPLAVSNKPDGLGYVLSDEEVETFNKKLNNRDVYFDIEHNGEVLKGITGEYDTIQLGNELVLMGRFQIHNTEIEEAIKSNKITGMSLQHSANSCIINNSLNYADIKCLTCLEPVSIAFTNRPKNLEEFIIIK